MHHGKRHLTIRLEGIWSPIPVESTLLLDQEERHYSGGPGDLLARGVGPMTMLDVWIVRSCSILLFQLFFVFLVVARPAWLDWRKGWKHADAVDLDPPIHKRLMLLASVLGVFWLILYFLSDWMDSRIP